MKFDPLKECNVRVYFQIIDIVYQFLTSFTSFGNLIPHYTTLHYTKLN